MKLILSLLLLLLIFPDIWVAAENNSPLLNLDSRESGKTATSEGGKKENDSKAPAPTFPGISEVGPKASELKINADDSRKLIATGTQLSSQKQEIDNAEGRLQKLKESISKFSDSDYWDVTKVADARLMVLKEEKDQQALMAKISDTLTEMESIRKEWHRQEAYWREWRVFLVADSSETLSETFNGAQKTIGKILEEISGAMTATFAMQNRVSRLLRDTVKCGEMVEAAISKQRTNMFKKNEVSLLNGEFYTQFNSTFWRSIYDNLGHFEDAPDSRSVWGMVARIFIAFTFGFIVLSLRETEQVGQDRLFLLHYPWSLGIFLAETLGIIFLGHPTGIARNLSWSLLTFSCLILISASLNIRLRRPVICFLAAIVAVPGILKLIPLPNPLFRLYWAFITLTGAYLFTVWAKQLRAKALAKKKFFSGCLRVGAVVMALSAIAQVAGFVGFSEKLLSFTLKIAFLVASIILLFQINRIMLLLLLEHSAIADMAFIRRFGKELGVRLKTLVNGAIWGIAFFFFLSIIEVYSSAHEAFEKLFLTTMTIGNLSLSPALGLLAALVLYLSSLISWVIRAILESEIFPHMQVDRGASQAVTKLLHYFLIFIGFLISMSLIGMDLKSFAVLGGALGIGIGFGLQDIVNNFISGLVLLFERPVRVGDRIEAGSQIGIVKKIGLRSTVIETLDQSELIIPNSQLVSEKVTNWTHSGTVARLKIPVGVAYGSDMDLVIDALTAAALASSRVLAHPKPSALLMGFGDSCLNMELQVWLTDVNEIRLAQSEISREILRRFGESKIEIPFPQQEVRLRCDETAQPIDVLSGAK